MARFSTDDKPQAYMRLALKIIVPQLLTFLLLLASMASLSVPYVGAFRLEFVLMPIFYWAIFHPALLPVWLAFILGLVVDIIVGDGIFGMNALLYTVVHVFIVSQRRYLMGQPFIVVWAGFIATSIILAGLRVALVSIFIGVDIQFMPLVFTVLLNCAFFPLIVLVLIRIHRLVSRQSGGY